MLFLAERTKEVEHSTREPLAIDEQELLRSYATRRLRISAYSLKPKFGLDGFEIALALTAPLALALPLIGLFALFV